MPETAVDITLFWRPGCGFCAALRRSLDQLDVGYRDVNIWEDPEGAAFVRSANGGNELVPTVRVGTTVLSNPQASQVLAAISDHADGAR